MRVTCIDDIQKLIDLITDQAMSNRPTQRIYKPCTQSVNEASGSLHNLMVSSTPKKLQLSWKVLTDKEEVKVHFEKFYDFQKQLSEKLRPLGYLESSTSCPQSFFFEKKEPTLSLSFY